METMQLMVLQYSGCDFFQFGTDVLFERMVVAFDVAPVAFSLVWDEREVGEPRLEKFTRRELRR